MWSFKGVRLIKEGSCGIWGCYFDLGDTMRGLERVVRGFGGLKYGVRWASCRVLCVMLGYGGAVWDLGV